MSWKRALSGLDYQEPVSSPGHPLVTWREGKQYARITKGPVGAAAFGGASPVRPALGAPAVVRVPPGRLNANVRLVDR